MRILGVIFCALLAACGGGNDQEHHDCAFFCGVPACYTPIAMSCGSSGYVIDSEEAGSEPVLCRITYHCR